MRDRQRFRPPIAAIFLLTLLISLTGCGAKYDLGIAVSGQGGVVPGPGIHQFKRDTIVTLATQPATGWYFAGWGGPDADWVEENAIQMKANRYITAVFAQLQHSLDITVEPAESGRVDAVIVPETRSIQHGQVVRLTAIPEPGYGFLYWNDHPDDKESPKLLTMEGPRTVKAVFAPRVADPVFSLEAGAYTGVQSVQINSDTPGATIRYTTDGVTVPSPTVGTILEASGSVSVNRSMVLKAVAYKEGLPASAVVTKTYTVKLTAPPVVSLDSGTYDDTQTVTITCPGATIRYTLDGSTPSPQHGRFYTDPIRLPGGATTLKAVAYQPDLMQSDVVTRNYTVYRWPQRAPMPTARKGLAAVSLNGKVYTIGGHDGTSYVTTLEVYDPASDTWETKASMSTARGYLSAVVLAGRIYALGGQVGSGYPATNTVEIYDPVTNTWSAGPPMLAQVGLISAVEHNGRIYVTSGGFKNDSSTGWYTALQIYDAHSNSWTAQAISCGLISYCAVLYGGQIYVIGGRDTDASYMTSSQIRIYDITENSWRNGADMGSFSGVEDAAAVSYNGRMYVFGGRRYFYNYYVRDTVRVYHPDSDSWTTADSMPFARHFHGAVVVDGRIFVFGGENASGLPLDDVREFLP